MKILKILILSMLPLSLFAWKMESASITLPATTSGSSIWQTVNLNQTYDTVPLVFALVDEGSGHPVDTPVIIRIRNVSTTSFEMVQVEAQSVVETVPNQGPHPSVNVHYLVIEAGDYTLNDGTRLLAGLHTTNTKQGKNASAPRGWDTVSLVPVFTGPTPIVLSMVQGVENETSTLPGSASTPWLTSTLRAVGSNSFQVALERAETSTGSISVDEDIGYLAISSAQQGTIFDTSTCEEIDYETILTGDNVRGWENGCYTSNFINTYVSNPNVVGAQNSRDGADGGWLRRCSLNTTAIGVNIDEDQAQKSGRGHTSEIVGLAIFEKSFVFDSSKLFGCKPAVAEYRMDECYWLDNAGGVIDDVKESINGLDGTSHGAAQIADVVGPAPKPMCMTGNFSPPGGLNFIDVNDDPLLTNANNFSFSFWMNSGFVGGGIEVIVNKTTTYNDGITIYTYDGGSATGDGYILFRVGNGSTVGQVLYTQVIKNQWVHIAGTYEGTILIIYLNGIPVASQSYNLGILNVNTPLIIGKGLNAQYQYRGQLDEFKLFDNTLSATDVNAIFSNESTGKNYDGTPRVCPTCTTSTIAGQFSLIGIPADLRTSPNKDVSDVFDEFPGASYNVAGLVDGWRVFKRIYDPVTNASSYNVVPYTGEALQFGQGYWIQPKASVVWSENSLIATDYNSTHPSCPANRCVEIDLTPVNKNFGAPDNDINDGSGRNRNNMLGFIGHTPVDWADCRILINGTAYTPSAADAAGFIDKQVWQYNPGAGGADANGYTTCDDTTPGGCKLEPYKGFWVILHGLTKNKTVKLLIPKE